MRTWVIAGGAVLALLLVGVAVLLVVVIGQNNAAAEQDDLDRVTAICEDRFADPYGDDLAEMVACQDDLLK